MGVCDETRSGMLVRIGTVVLAAAVGSIVACGGEGGGIAEEDAAAAWAEVACAYELECGCPDPEHADVDACVDDKAASLEEYLAAGVAAGWTYDPDCVAARNELSHERGCKTWQEASTETVEELCAIWCGFYYGDVPEGELCEGNLIASNCARGLTCAGACRPCGWAEGDGPGEPCTVGSCAGPDSFCNVEDPGTPFCEERRGLGEPCTSSDQCSSQSCLAAQCVDSGPVVCGLP